MTRLTYAATNQPGAPIARWSCATLGGQTTGPVAAHSSARIVSDMSRSRGRRYAALVLVTALLGGVSFFWGDENAHQRMVITRATPDQLATAMQNDVFFSDYGASTLLIDATVASVITRAGVTTVTVVTTSRSTLACDLGQLSTTAHAGDAVILVAEGAGAQRQSAGVLLQGCTLAR